MKKLFIIGLTILVLSILSFTATNACPKCNADFKKELLEKRANTLGGQELLEAIKNQDGENSVVLPVKYVSNNAPEGEDNQQMTTENNTEDNSISSFSLIKLLIVTWFFNR